MGQRKILRWIINLLLEVIRHFSVQCRCTFSLVICILVEVG